MQTQALAQTRAPVVAARSPSALATPIDPARAPMAADARSQAPRAARSLRWAAGLSSVLVSVMIFGTVVDLFQGASGESLVAASCAGTHLA